MAVVEFNMNPSDRDLRWFGVIVLIFFGLIGGLVFWYSGAMTVPVVLWIVGAVLCAIYYAIAPTRRLIYRGWMRTFYPLGWLVSHLLFGAIYFVVFTPMGLVMRLVGYDPLDKRGGQETKTNWVERRPVANSARYFKQF